MLAPEIEYVVGIDVAKHSHTVCVLQTRTAAVVQRPRTIAATAEGYAAWCTLRGTWGAPL